MGLEYRSVDVDDRVAHFVQRDADADASMTILFVHGFPLNQTLWQEQLKGLPSHCRLLAPDLPGFGRSQPMETATQDGDGRPVWTMTALADWLDRFLDALDIETPIETPIVFCGLSMGGYIGWEFARRHRQRLGHLVACHTRAAADSDVVRRARSVAATQVLETGAEPIAEAMLPKLFGVPLASVDAEQIELIQSSILKTPAESIAAGHLGMGQRADASGWLETIDVPTLFVAGRHDGITPADEMESDCQRMPNASFVCLEQAGHLGPLQDPTAFNQLLVDWLQENANA